jgi:NAD(P)-dependent dehydrogenase (short-subunit alcohol dehydrogenase family)
MTRTAVVTGASRGLGAVMARKLAADGWSVAVSFRSDRDSAARVLDDIRSSGGRAEAYAGDATDEDDVADLVRRAGADLGPVLAVVANATGPQPTTAIEDLSWQSHLDQLTFFVKSPTLLVQAALPTMKAHNFGRVIMIGSDMVGRAKPLWSAYTAAKAAQGGLTRVWSRELGPHGVTVNLVAPGFVPVERHAGAETEDYRQEVPLGRMGTPDDVAAMVAFLASDAAGFVTGQQIAVNGAHTL